MKNYTTRIIWISVVLLGCQLGAASSNAHDLPLIKAVKDGNRKFIETQINLLRQNQEFLNAHMNKRDEFGNSLLHLAVQAGQLALIPLLAQYIDLNAVNRKGYTPLMEALFARNPRMVRALLDAGADINFRDPKFGRTPVLWAYLSEPIMTKRLIRAGADLNIADQHGTYPLHVAVQRDNAEDVNYFLKHGARVDVRNSNGHTPLDMARTLGRKNIIPLLEGRP